MNHAKQYQARIIGQIQGCYSNAKALIGPTLPQVDFEKAIEEDKTKFYFEEVIKSYASEALTAIEKETDEVKKSELATNAAAQFASLEPVKVVFNKVTKSLYVDVIDTETGLYKDNAVNRKLDRVGQKVAGK